MEKIETVADAIAVIDRIVEQGEPVDNTSADSTEVADALINFGIVIDDERGFTVDEQRFAALPSEQRAALREFVDGMCG